ncbi:unnamed protein product, partial [Cyprideis torosa]
NAEYTTGQIQDVSSKLKQSLIQLNKGTPLSFNFPESSPGGAGEKKSEDKLGKAARDASKATTEVIHGLMSQIIKDKLFNQISRSSAPCRGSLKT